MRISRQGGRRQTAVDGLALHQSDGQMASSDPSSAARRLPTSVTHATEDAPPLNTSMRLKAVTNSFAVIIAQAINKASTYIAFIIVSMQLPIADFGLYNLVFAIGQILNSVATFGMDQVLIRLLAQQGAREQRKRLLHDAIILKLVSSALAGAILLDALLWLRSSSDLVFGMAIMVADLLVVNLASTLISYDRARLRSTGPTLIQSGTRAIYIVLLLVAARQGIPWYGLLEMLLVADALACAALAWHVGRRVRDIAAVGAPHRLAMFRDAVPLGVAAVGVLLYTRLDTILVANMRNVSEVAYYSASYKFTEAPLTIITAISATVLPLISAWSMTGSWRERVAGGSQRALRYAYVLSLGAAVTVTFFGGALVRLLYGSRYESILPTVIVLIWGTVAMASNSVSSSILTGLGRQRLLMAIVGVNLLVNVSVNLWAIPRWGYFGSALATTATEGVNALVQVTALCILLKRVRLAWTTVIAIAIGAVNLTVYFGISARTTHLSPLIGVAALVGLVLCLVVFRLVTREDLHVIRRLGARVRRGRSAGVSGSLALEQPAGIDAGASASDGFDVPRPMRQSAFSFRFKLITTLVFFFLGASAIVAGIVIHRMSWFTLVVYILFSAMLLVARTWPAAALLALFASITMEYFNLTLLRDFGHVRLDMVLGSAVAVGIVLRVLNAGALRSALANIPGLLPLALFFVVSIESTTLASQNRLYGATLLAELLAGALCYVGMPLLIREVGRLRRITVPLMAIAAVQVTIGIVALIVSTALHHPLPFGMRREPGTGLIEPSGTMIEPNFFGIYLAAITILGAALIIGLAKRRRLFTPRTISFAAVSVLAAIGAVVSLTRAAWIALVVGLVLTTLLAWYFGMFSRQPDVTHETGETNEPAGSFELEHLIALKRNVDLRRRWLAIVTRIGVVAILAVGIGVAAVNGELATLLARFQRLLDVRNGSGLGRIEVLQLVLQDWQRSPLTGLGAGSFTGHLPGVPSSDHVWIYSMGLTILHDSGVVGVALFVWFLAAVGYALLRAIGDSREPAVRALGIGALGAAACMLFGAQTTSSLYLPLFWVFLGLAGAIPTLVERFRVIDASPLATRIDGQNLPDVEQSVLHLYDSSDLMASDETPQALLWTARGLVESGWTCSAICAEDDPLDERLKQAGVLTERVAPWDTRRWFPVTLQLMRHIQRWRPDVVMVYGPAMGGIGSLAARLAGVSLVVYQTDGATFRNGQRTRGHSMLLERVACFCADTLWCTSASVRDEYVVRRMIRPAKAHTAPPDVEPESLEQSGGNLEATRTAARLRRELGWEQRGPIVGYVSRHISEHGAASLLRACVDVLRNQPEARVLIAGDTPGQARLLQLARELGLASHVAFVGATPDTLPCYLLSDVIVYASTGAEDGFGALQAMAAGRPVVAASNSEAAKRIVDGESGRVTPPEDSIALADALLWVLQSPKHTRQLGANAHEHARVYVAERGLTAQVGRLLGEELRSAALD
jgi:O-antigen/teichoic acid export membrane protein/glycosyltransferase involved in cell wall biosynthesis